jgi:photosystem II stability/assembly factor-like uncharacterized protein
MNRYMKIFCIMLITAQAHLAYGQWKKSTIIGGHANVYVLAERDDTIYAGTDVGLYSSTNNGNQWANLGRDYVSSLVIGDGKIFTGVTSGGVSLSTDHGTTWSSANNGLTNPRIMCLAVSDSRLFAGTRRCYGRWCDNIPGALFSSTDYGANWSVAGLVGLDVITLSVEGTKIYAGTNDGIYISSDNGISWNSISADLTNVYVLCFAAMDNTLFVGSYGKVYVSTNGGLNWNSVGKFSSALEIRALLAVGQYVYAGTSDGLYLTTNNGSSWIATDSGLASKDINALLRAGPTLYVGTKYRGVFSSTDGAASWNLKSTGLTKIDGTNAFSSFGETLVAGTYGDGLFVSTDHGVTWCTKSQSPAYITSLALSGSHLLAGSSNGLFISFDTCATWSPSYDGPWTLAQTSSKALAGIGSNLYASFNNGFFSSTDGGLSWNASSIWGEYGAWVKSFASNGSDYFAGTWDGAYLSTDSGLNWKTINNGISNDWGLNINAIATNGNNVFLAAFGAGMYISKDKGSSWAKTNNGLTDSSNIQSLTITRSDIFVGTSQGGIFHSSDSGADWESINTGLAEYDIRSLFVNGSTLYAGSSSGIFLRPLSEVTKVDNTKLRIPNEYMLARNYPNPFNPSTTIRFSIPMRSRVRVTIFNLLGQQVAELANEELGAGNFERTWNANVASGLYFYRLEAVSVSNPGKRFVDVKKMILLK